MRDAIERYLEDVLAWADLARNDERAVRAELNEHLQTQFSGKLSPDLREAYTMMSDEFGKPSVIGRGIARSKGIVRTFLKKQRRKAPITCGIALLLGLAVRLTVAQAFYAPSTGGEPQIPMGSHVLVYKLARQFSPGDVIVFRFADGTYRFGIVQSQSDKGLVVSKRDQPNMAVDMDQVVGRVFLNTR
jgi:Signal peptidase, peptidase S26